MSRTPILTLIDAYGEAVARHRTGERPSSYVDEKLDAVKRKLSQSRDDALECAARVCDAQETESFMVLSTARDGAAAMKAACVKAIRSLKAKPAPIAAPIASGDAGCICHGNWRLIVKESQPLFGRKYRADDGEEWTFFGVVHADDDYYYGMSRKGKTLLLSCVGSIEGFGFTLVDTAIRKGAE